MGLLQKLKSALGLDASGSPSAGTNTPQDVDVTVEREPSTASEDAVKGTETSGEQSEGTAESETPAAEGETAEASSDDADEEPAADDDEETVETVDDVTSSDDDPPVTEVNGIGPAYAERLEAAGISTVSELAGADAEELGEATDLSPNRISGWIEQANSF